MRSAALQPMLVSMLSVSDAAIRCMRAPPPTMQIQGGSRRTWSHQSHSDGTMDEMHVELGSDGRPVNAEFELWQGPGNTPVSSRVYGDDGYSRPVYASIGTGGRSYTNTASIQNAGPLEFPINANLRPGTPEWRRQQREMEMGAPRPQDDISAKRRSSTYLGNIPDAGRGAQQGARIQGGTLRTFTFDPSVGSVTINLRSEGMPISASIEILQGPNSDRQGIELYSDDGRRKPVSYLLELPGYGSTISITNLGPVAYPLTVDVAPYGPQRAGSPYDEASRRGVVMGGGMMGGGGNMGGGDMGASKPDRYGRTVNPRTGQRYDRGGRYNSHLENGRKWHEQREPQRRGPPPSFAQVAKEMERMELEDGYGDAAPAGMVEGAPARRVEEQQRAASSQPVAAYWRGPAYPPRASR